MPSFFAGLRPEGLCLRGVRARRGAREILSGIDLCVRPGAFVALVGRNGSGKSTLLLALKGALPLDGGDAVLDGTRLLGAEPAVGLVLANPEDQGVSPVVADDVAFGLECQGLAPGDIGGRVEEALRLVDLWELRDAPVHTLSGGQLQRVAIASVLALGARYLLLDEATSMLSPWDRDALLRSLSDLRRAGLGIVLVTHQPEEVLWADEVVALGGGGVRFHGCPADYFGWEGCPWLAPEYLRLAAAVRAGGGVLPAYPDLCSWLEGPP